MCDLEFDLTAARWEAFLPWIKARISSGRPWSMDLLVNEVRGELPGLCIEEPLGLAGPTGEPSWATVARAVCETLLERTPLPSVAPSGVPLAPPRMP